MVGYAKGRGISKRRGSTLLHVSRSMCTYDHCKPVADAALCQRIRELSSLHPAWGYRLIHGWLREQGETSSLGRIRRLWKKLGLAALWRKKHRKIKRGARLNPPAHVPNSVWCMDFSEDRLQSGRKFFSLLVKDEATAFGLEIEVASSFKARDVESVLDRLVDTYGKPQYARCDNGGQFIAYAVQMWAERKGVRMAYIDPGKPWQNGSAESFVGTYRREVLDAEVFFTLKDAAVLSQRWKTMYNNERPHSKLGYRPPATAYNKHMMTNGQHF
jgi:putative transposase